MNGQDEEAKQESQPLQAPGSDPNFGQFPLYTPEQEAMLRNEAEELKRKVGRFFNVYEFRPGLDAMAFHCRVNEDTLEENFESLRNLLKPDYIPMLTHEGGEHIIFVMRKPKQRYKGINVNLALLIITLITTTISGSLLWTSYAAAIDGIPSSELDPWMVVSAENLFFGAVFFALPLLLILGTHETGHYLMAKRHGVAASLPFFIPMLPPLGTLGAVISMREPIPNKKALIDIGAAGPIAGLIVALPVTIAGFILTNVYSAPVQPNEPGGLLLYNPLILIGLGSLFPIESGVLAHPTYFAGWVGILVTALNLLPAGQLDGGHITRALFGDKTRFIGIITVVSMFILGFIFNYFGYIILIVIIMVLGGGLGHPPPLNDVSKLDQKRIFVGIVALVVFIVSFHPAPIQPAGIPGYGFDLTLSASELEAQVGGNVSFNISVMNKGDVKNDAWITLDMNSTRIEEGWNASITVTVEGQELLYNISDQEALFLTFEESETINATVDATASGVAQIGENITLFVRLNWYSWEENDLGEIIKKTRERSQLVVIRVK